MAAVPEFAALLAEDKAAMGELGLNRIAFALLGLFKGITPEEFAARVREFMARAEHPTLRRPLRATTYQPMLELVGALRELDFTVCIVTGGGTEFVRAVSQDLYGVPPEAVVGSLVSYTYSTEPPGPGRPARPVLRRTTALDGEANEGAAKVSNIQAQLGRRPIMAAGNSGGDREMLEWAAGGEGPSLALLVDHDDAEREFAYVSTAADLRGAGADHRGGRPCRVDGGQHGPRLGDGLRPLTRHRACRPVAHWSADRRGAPRGASPGATAPQDALSQVRDTGGRRQQGESMNGTTLTPRAHRVLTRIEAWAHEGRVRALVVKVGVTVFGPLVIAVGVAMLVLPGPGLVVMALGAALLALEYDWARRALASCGRTLNKGRRAVVPKDASMARRAFGVATTVALLFATTGITAAVTTYVGTAIV